MQAVVREEAGSDIKIKMIRRRFFNIFTIYETELKFKSGGTLTWFSLGLPFGFDIAIHLPPWLINKKDFNADRSRKNKYIQFNGSGRVRLLFRQLFGIQEDKR